MQYGFKNTLALMRRVKLAQRQESQLNAGFEKQIIWRYSHSIVAGGLPEIS